MGHNADGNGAASGMRGAGAVDQWKMSLEKHTMCHQVGGDRKIVSCDVIRTRTPNDGA